MSTKYEGLSLVELIDLLEEVPQPPPVALTPQTPGWIVIGVIATALLAAFAIWLWQRWQSNAYRRAAVASLIAAGDDATEIATILRRTALSAYPRSVIVPLTGDDWLAFLDRTCPGVAFANSAARSLASAPYDSQSAPPELRDAAVTWVRGHQTKGGA
ncbi:MAG: DUF4381 domain-containing protein [Pseudomonadota bacterium]